MNFISSVMLVVGVGLGALGMLAMSAGAVCSALADNAGDEPPKSPSTGRRP